MPQENKSTLPLIQPQRKFPKNEWNHYNVWDRVNNLIYSLPNYFETDLIIRGINATEIFSIGSAFTTIINSQVVDILNRHRSIWDPENEYSNYIFVRQSQTFPDVLLRNIENEKDILFGIELKSWYVLSKEGEPSFRYKVGPDACAEADLIVIIPWILSEVVSGTPRLLIPYKELAKYVAEYRNYYWQKSRTDNQLNFNIRKPLKAKPYPNSKEEASDEAEDDKGNNFGRIARAGILDDYTSKTKAQDYLGVKINHWIRFFKAVAETSTDLQIEREIENLKSLIQTDINLNEDENVEYKIMFSEIIERLEKLWKKCLIRR